MLAAWAFHSAGETDKFTTMSSMNWPLTLGLLAAATAQTPPPPALLGVPSPSHPGGLSSPPPSPSLTLISPPPSATPPCTVLGCLDPQSSTYCPYGFGPGECCGYNASMCYYPIKGCMDPLAINYLSEAQVENVNEPCEYEPGCSRRLAVAIVLDRSGSMLGYVDGARTFATTIAAQIKLSSHHLHSLASVITFASDNSLTSTNLTSNRSVIDAEIAEYGSPSSPAPTPIRTPSRCLSRTAGTASTRPAAPWPSPVSTP